MFRVQSALVVSHALSVTPHPSRVLVNKDILRPPSMPSHGRTLLCLTQRGLTPAVQRRTNAAPRDTSRQTKSGGGSLSSCLRARASSSNLLKSRRKSAIKLSRKGFDGH